MECLFDGVYCEFASFHRKFDNTRDVRKFVNEVSNVVHRFLTAANRICILFFFCAGKGSQVLDFLSSSTQENRTPNENTWKKSWRQWCAFRFVKIMLVLG